MKLLCPVDVIILATSHESWVRFLYGKFDSSLGEIPPLWFVFSFLQNCRVEQFLDSTYFLGDFWDLILFEFLPFDNQQWRVKFVYRRKSTTSMRDLLGDRREPRPHIILNILYTSYYAKNLLQACGSTVLK